MKKSVNLPTESFQSHCFGDIFKLNRQSIYNPKKGATLEEGNHRLCTLISQELFKETLAQGSQML